MEKDDQRIQGGQDGNHRFFYCQKCGTKNSANFSYCHKCGVKLTRYNLCNECKNYSLDTSIHCNFCGTLIGETKEEKFPIQKIFSESRIELYIGILGLAVSIIPIISIESFLRYLSYETIEIICSNLKNIALFSFIITSSIYNIKIPKFPNKLVYLGFFISIITSGICGFIASGTAGGKIAILDSFLAGLIILCLGYIIFQWFRSIGGGTVKYSIVIGMFLGSRLLLSFIALIFLFLIPKYILDIYVRERKDFVNTIPYISLSAFFTIILNINSV